MTKLKLGPLIDDKPVKLSVEIPASVHRDLLDYARILSAESGRLEMAPRHLIPPMLTRFMATDRAFLKARRSGQPSGGAG